ncbi:MAG: TonB family protein [Gammaproteobacteria bacterium]|nr:TonB family protein [Gammaproteobacteria bacterium]
MTLFLAAAVHGIVILGVGFGAVIRDHAPHSSLDVVLVQTPSRQAPAQADNIAHASSRASGSVDAPLRPSSPALTSAVAPPEDQAFAATLATEAAPAASPDLRLVTSIQSRTAVLQDQQQRAREPHTKDESESRPQTELARLSAQLSEDVQRYAQRPRVNYIDTLSATTAPEAAYVRAWVDKVERVGNLNYPDDARRRALSGSLILHVLLNSEGDIIEVLVGSPSGQQVLDDAARRTVELAAPFMPFSSAMRAQYDQLMLTRTWVFAAEGELSTR